jgi:hypothetical protein
MSSLKTRLNMARHAVLGYIEMMKGKEMTTQTRQLIWGGFIAKIRQHMTPAKCEYCAAPIVLSVNDVIEIKNPHAPGGPVKMVIGYGDHGDLTMIRIDG